MKDNNHTWQDEIDRRAGLYDDIEARNAWQGRMTATDYVGLLALVVILVAGFWMWGN